MLFQESEVRDATKNNLNACSFRVATYRSRVRVPNILSLACVGQISISVAYPAKRPTTVYNGAVSTKARKAKIKKAYFGGACGRTRYAGTSELLQYKCVCSTRILTKYERDWVSKLKDTVNSLQTAKQTLRACH